MKFVEGFADSEAIANLAKLYNTGNMKVTNLEVTNGLTVKGASTLNTIRAIGASTLNTLNATGASTLNTLRTTGASTLGSTNITGNVNIAGTTIFNGNTSHRGAANDFKGNNWFPYTDGKFYIRSPLQLDGTLNGSTALKKGDAVALHHVSGGHMKGTWNHVHVNGSNGLQVYLPAGKSYFKLV